MNSKYARPSLLTRLEFGAKLRGIRACSTIFVQSCLSILGILAAILQILGDELPIAQAAVGVLVGGVLVTACAIVAPTHRSGKRGKTKVTLKIGDLFDEGDTTHLAVGVNERFDCLIGNRVSNNSLHGQLILRLFANDTQRFERAIDESLAALQVPPLLPATGTERPGYAIGTVATVEHGSKSVFAVGMAHTDVTNDMAHADVADLWASLQGLWARVRERSNGQPVAIPVFGTGFARIPLDPDAILELILSSIEDRSSQSSITPGGISIIIRASEFRDFDLRRQLLT